MSPTATIRDISNPDKQMVEIAKALSRDARVIIMDEATAVLTEREAEDAMAMAMVGRDVSSLYPAPRRPVGDDTVLSVRNLTVPGYARDIDFTLRAGEILGVSGLIARGGPKRWRGWWSFAPRPPISP